MNVLSQSEWQPKPPAVAGLSADMVDWLRHPGSLTARLQSRGAFAVRVLNQGLARLSMDDAFALGIASGRLVWTREVELRCNGQPVVFAHTVLPRHPRGPVTRWLARLGSHSLGTLLFTHSGFTRGPLSFKRIDARHPLFTRASQTLGTSPDTPLWARRSCFRFGQQSVLVTEIFSPAISGPRR